MKKLKILILGLMLLSIVGCSTLSNAWQALRRADEKFQEAVW